MYECMRSSLRAFRWEQDRILDFGAAENNLLENHGQHKMGYVANSALGTATASVGCSPLSPLEQLQSEWRYVSRGAPPCFISWCPQCFPKYVGVHRLAIRASLSLSFRLALLDSQSAAAGLTKGKSTRCHLTGIGVMAGQFWRAGNFPCSSSTSLL